METGVEALGHHLKTVLQPSVGRQGLLLESNPEGRAESQGKDDEWASRTKLVTGKAVYEGQDQ